MVRQMIEVFNTPSQGMMEIEPAIRIQADKAWQPVYMPYTPEKAYEQAVRCITCTPQPCGNGISKSVTGCPSGNSISSYFQAHSYAGVNNPEAMKRVTNIVFSKNTLAALTSALCDHASLCQGACTAHAYKDFKGGTVQIGNLELYYARMAMQNIAKEGFDSGWIPAIRPRYYLNKNVAIIGGGPAGLGAARVLMDHGISVTIYDYRSRIGGLMGNVIPHFKSPDSDVEFIQRWFEDAHVKGDKDAKLFSAYLGSDYAIDSEAYQELLNKHDAVIMATGTIIPRIPADFEGADLWTQADDALTEQNQVNRGEKRHAELNDVKGKVVMIYGAGDTMLDMARTAIRNGAAKIYVLYRGPEAKMRANPKDLSHFGK